MKKYLTIIIILSYNLLYSQCTNGFITDLQYSNTKSVMSGSCSSPDGADNKLLSSPSDYNYLNTNGYCYTVGSVTKDFIGCYTFTAQSTEANFNAGYATTGCTGLLINYANLYTQTTCSLVATGVLGVYSSLVIGQSYTWCINLKCTGPGPGITSFCPYYIETVTLPIELLSFDCKNINDYNQLEWIVASQSNNKQFELYHSLNAVKWDEIGVIQGAGSTGLILKYDFIDYFPNLGVNYYKLRQVDYNGSFKDFYITYCYNDKDNLIIKYYNILGQEINISDFNGIYIEKIINKDKYKVIKQFK